MFSLVLQILSYVGGAILALSALPQVIKTYKNRSTNGVAIVMIWACVIGLGLNITYSIGTKQPSLYIPMALSIFLNVTLLIMHYIFMCFPQPDRDIIPMTVVTVVP